VGKPNGIPVLGEMMASRWAFEAFMVTQFKDNPFEKQFYRFDQKEAEADYKRTYLVPALESKLTYVLSKRPDWRNTRNVTVVNSLELLRSEIKYELEKVGSEKFPEVDLLQTGKFDSTVYVKTKEFLSVLRKYYAIRANNAKKDRETLIASMTDTPEKKKLFSAMKLRYENESVTNMVENSNELNRIVEWRGRLIQKFYPIYFEDHRPRNRFDFQANFYVPTKYFVGEIYDTFYFNLSVIWIMAVVLYLTLYFDLLKRGVHALENWRKYGKRKKIVS
jgi:hypothetical protein